MSQQTKQPQTAPEVTREPEPQAPEPRQQPNPAAAQSSPGSQNPPEEGTAPEHTTSGSKQPQASQSAIQKNRMGRVLSILGTLCIVFVILLYALLVLPEAIGWHTYNVISGSMEPSIPIGSLIYVKEGAPEDVQTDDVIAFYSAGQDGSIITHRVVSNNVVSGLFTTKGDANAGEDPEPAAYDRYIGKVNLHIPGMGKLLILMTSFYGKIAAACLIALGAVLSFAGTRLRDQNPVPGKPRKASKNATKDEPAEPDAKA